MPEIAHQLLELQLDTDAGEANMLKLIERDPQISARVIGLANSSSMGIGKKVNSISDAAMLLGMKRLKSVAIGIASMSKLLDKPASKYFDPHDLWKHSMMIAIVMNSVARLMPRRIRPDENQIFLAGLLHDIGLMALHYLDPIASNELHRQLLLHPQIPMSEIEMKLLGMSHGYIGAQLLRHWQLPKEIIEVVELHHSQYSQGIALSNPLIKLVIIAEKTLPDFGCAEHTLDTIETKDWHEICVHAEHTQEILELANEIAMQVAQLPDTYSSLTIMNNEMEQPATIPVPEKTELHAHQPENNVLSVRLPMSQRTKKSRLLNFPFFKALKA